MALRAAFNDVSRAASYLMEGIPEGAMDEADDVNAEPRGEKSLDGSRHDIPLSRGRICSFGSLVCSL